MLEQCSLLLAFHLLILFLVLPDTLKGFFEFSVSFEWFPVFKIVLECAYYNVIQCVLMLMLCLSSAFFRLGFAVSLLTVFLIVPRVSLNALTVSLNEWTVSWNVPTVSWNVLTVSWNVLTVY